MHQRPASRKRDEGLPQLVADRGRLGLFPRYPHAPPIPYAAIARQRNAMSDQHDLFGPAQLGLGLEDTRPDPTHVDPQSVREELNAILAVARAARDQAPWDRRTHQYHQVVFPQMTNWLPPEEAEFLRRQFSLELERIEPLLAAA